jgi:hypothetical protein
MAKLRMLSWGPRHERGLNIGVIVIQGFAPGGKILNLSRPAKGDYWITRLDAMRMVKQHLKKYSDSLVRLWLLLAYTIVWTLYGILAKSSQDLHYDMAELAGMSRELAWGYPHHRPL